jgi:mono/diheme cytochrome c family protein
MSRSLRPAARFLFAPAFLLVALAPARAQATPRPPAKIFAAACATCHGADGLGGPSWTDSGAWAPRIARALPTPQPATEEQYKFTIRNGPYVAGGFDFRMPAFGHPVLSDAELDLLVTWVLYQPPVGAADPTWGVPPPPTPPGNRITLEILDEAPWFRDDATDVRDTANDRRRVVLSAGDYVKVINRGKTWHTVTNRTFNRDTGFIGYADNILGQDIGYYYLEAADLEPGAWKYFCSLHPYMQVEIVTDGYSPTPLTHVSKIALSPPRKKGVGEIWVGLQTYNNVGAPNGAVDVIDASTWARTLIPNVGNNPHNGWLGTARDLSGVLRNVAVYANWHDVTVTVVDADTKLVIGSLPIGAAGAHVMTAPGVLANGANRWFITLMGSNKVQEIDPFLALSWQRPNFAAIGQSDGRAGTPAFSPHGLWFLDDGDHFLTANTLANSASLYSISRPWSDPDGRTGDGAQVANTATGGRSPLAASILNTGDPGSTSYAGYTNNASTDDISVYAIDATPNAESIARVAVPPPLGNAAGNLALTDMMAMPVRWSHMPIQCAISPPDSTTHGRFMTVCNKASFNVNIVPLDENGMPAGIYTFPAGLGCHGIAYGRKRFADPDRIAYFAYVTNTFENYVSVYDLEVLARAIRCDEAGVPLAAFQPGAATEQVYVEGYAAQVLLGQPSGLVPVTLFTPDARGLVHIGDVPLSTPAIPGPRSYLQEHVWIDLPGWGMTEVDLDLKTDSGAMGIAARTLPPPW